MPLAFVRSMKNLWMLAIAGLLPGCNYGSEDEEVGSAASASEATQAPTPARVFIGETEYRDLESAAAAAQPGDQIDVGEGIAALRSTVLLPEGVTVAGAGPHLTVIAVPEGGVGIQLVLTGDMAVLRNLAVSGGSVGIDAAGGMLDLLNVVLRGCEVGIRALDDSVVRANFVTAIDNRIAFHSAAASFKMSNSIVNRNEVGARVESGTPASFRYSNFGENQTDFLGGAAGEGCTAHAISFLDDGRERAGSLSVDAADPIADFDQEPMDNGGRANQGAFGNTIWATTTSWVQ